MGIYILFKRVNSHKQVYARMHPFAHVYTGIKKQTVFRVLYISKQRYTQVKTGIRVCAYTNTQVYKGIKRHKWIYTFVYTSIYKYTQV